MIGGGLGRHATSFSAARYTTFLRADFVCRLLYPLCLVFVKFAILALYLRIFTTHTSIKYPLGVLTIVVTLWGLAVVSFIPQHCQYRCSRGLGHHLSCSVRTYPVHVG